MWRRPGDSPWACGWTRERRTRRDGRCWGCTAAILAPRERGPLQDGRATFPEKCCTTLHGTPENTTKHHKTPPRFQIRAPPSHPGPRVDARARLSVAESRYLPVAARRFRRRPTDRKGVV